MPTCATAGRWVGRGRPVAAAVTLALLGFPGAAATATGDPPRCHGQVATIVGTDGPDLLQGTPGADVIVGLDGRDDIFGEGGDDVICAGANPAELDEEGYPVAETIDGGDGDDLIHAGPGRDGVTTGRGDDRAHGGPGDDGLVGVNRDRDENRGGFDRLFGGPGDDELRAWTSRVVLRGGGGNDVLEGDDHDDRLAGGVGADVLSADAGDDTVSGGPGVDVVDYRQVIAFARWSSHRSSVRVDLTAGVASGRRFGTDRLADDVEGAYTGDGSDRLVGDRGRNIFYAGYGTRSVIDGRGGRDLLSFDSGGIDGFCCEPVRLDLATGEGRAASPYGGVTRLRVRAIEDVHGSGEDDVLLGDAGPNRLVGGDHDHAEFGDGDDRLEGRGGDDVLTGGGDDDALRGGAGDDTLTGGHGDDLLDGGAGTNRNDAGPGNDRCLNPAAGPGCA